MSESADATPSVEFDVDAWLTEAKPPQRAVVVYGRADLLAEMQAVAAEPEPAHQSVGGSEKDRRLRRLREQLDASRRVFRVRALMHAERNALIDAHTTKSVDEAGEKTETFDAFAYEEAAMAMAIVDPALTVEQVKTLHAAIGEAQWAVISRAAQEATEEPIDVPLSRLGSGSSQDS